MHWKKNSNESIKQSIRTNFGHKTKKTCLICNSVLNLKALCYSEIPTNHQSSVWRRLFSKKA